MVYSVIRAESFKFQSFLILLYIFLFGNTQSPSKSYTAVGGDSFVSIIQAHAAHACSYQGETMTQDMLQCQEIFFKPSLVLWSRLLMFGPLRDGNI